MAVLEGNKEYMLSGLALGAFLGIVVYAILDAIEGDKQRRDAIKEEWWENNTGYLDAKFAAEYKQNER